MCPSTRSASGPILTNAEWSCSHDKDVIIERVKNRLDPDHDPEATGGYRCVAINIRLSTKETRGLGIDTHFCEVQLILTDFAKMKVRVCGRMLVQWRACM